MKIPRIITEWLEMRATHHKNEFDRVKGKGFDTLNEENRKAFAEINQHYGAWKELQEAIDRINEIQGEVIE